MPSVKSTPYYQAIDEKDKYTWVMIFPSSYVNSIYVPHSDNLRYNNV